MLRPLPSSGLELLTVFKKQLDDYLEQRQELKSAEKLFDMPITVFQDLLQIQKDMKGLEQLYSIYKEQKVLLVVSFLIIITIVIVDDLVTVLVIIFIIIIVAIIIAAAAILNDSNLGI